MNPDVAMALAVFFGIIGAAAFCASAFFYGRASAFRQMREEWEKSLSPSKRMMASLSCFHERQM